MAIRIAAMLARSDGVLRQAWLALLTRRALGVQGLAWLLERVMIDVV